MTQPFETTLSKLDDLCGVLEKTDFSSPTKKSKEAAQAYYVKAEQKLEEERNIIRELELEFNKGLETERELQKSINESYDTVRTQQQLMKDYQSKVTEEKLRRDKLSTKLESLQQQIENESNDEAIEQKNDNDALKLAIFRTMGIQMQVEDDCQVKKAIITTPDGQDIRTIPIKNHNTNQTTKNIWEFISRDLK